MPRLTRRSANFLLPALLAGTIVPAEAAPRQPAPPKAPPAAADESDSGLREMVLSTFDLQRIARPMSDVADYAFRELPDAPPEQFAQWHVPPACTRIEQGLLVPRASKSGRGALRLVKFHGVEQKVMRSSQRSWDTGGIYDVDVYSTDAATAYRKLQRYGWTALGEPARYVEGNFDSTEVVIVGPDGFNLAVIQRYSPPMPAQLATQLISPIFNSSQMVANLEQSTAFYTKVLGWEPTAIMNIDNAVEPGADVIGLPMPMARTAKRRIGIYHPPGSAASVELIENASMHGRDFAADCVAPNVGLLALRIPVPNAARYAAEIEKRGGQLYAPPKKLDIAPYGPVTQFSVRAPEGAIVEFFDAPFEKMKG